MKTKTTLSSLAAALVLVACQNLTQTERAQQDAQATETELRLMQGQLGNVRTLLSHQPPDSPSHQQLNIQVALLQRQVASLQDRLGAANRSASSAVAASIPSAPSTPPAATNTVATAINNPPPAANVPDPAAVAAALAALGLAGPPNTTPAPATPADPAAAVRHWIDELAADRPGPLWAALPDSFHTQVKNLITQSHQELDPEVLAKTFTVLKKANTVLKTKKAIILDFIKDSPLAGAEPELPGIGPDGLPAGPNANALPATPQPVPPAPPLPLQPGNPPAGQPLPTLPVPGGGPALDPTTGLPTVAPGGEDSIKAPRMDMAVRTQLFEQNWDSITGFLDSLLNSPLADPQWRANPNLDDFIQSNGGGLAQHLFDFVDSIAQAEAGMSLRQIYKMLDIQTVSENGNTATVRITPHDADPNENVNVEALELELEKTGNQWRIATLPADLAQSFTDAQADLKDFAAQFQGPGKAQALMLLTNVEAKLDGLAQAANAQEFQTQVMALVGSLAAAIQPGAEPVPAPGPGVFVPPAPGGGIQVDPNTGLPVPAPAPPNGNPAVPVPPVDPDTGLPITPRPAPAPNGAPPPSLPGAPPAPPKAQP